MEKMSFENFIVDESNKVAVEEVKTMENAKGLECAPLLISGEIGVGKTHLVTALKNETKENVAIATIEEIVYELIDSIKAEKVNEFKFC